jgi:hypothetical protein
MGRSLGLSLYLGMRAWYHGAAARFSQVGRSRLVAGLGEPLPLETPLLSVPSSLYTSCGPKSIEYQVVTRYEDEGVGEISYWLGLRKENTRINFAPSLPPP